MFYTTGNVQIKFFNILIFSVVLFLQFHVKRFSVDIYFTIAPRVYKVTKSELPASLQLPTAFFLSMFLKIEGVANVIVLYIIKTPFEQTFVQRYSRLNHAGYFVSDIVYFELCDLSFSNFL